MYFPIFSNFVSFYQMPVLVQKVVNPAEAKNLVHGFGYLVVHP